MRNRHKPNLNKVDRHIKLVMLNYPMLYPSRFSVLRHLFLCNGNGYFWNENGCIECIDADRTLIEQMDYSDLEEREQQLHEDIHRDKDSALGSLWSQRYVELKRLRSDRALIERDIDMYAKYHVMGEDQLYDTYQVRNFKPDYCIMTAAPYAKMDKEWGQAAVETFGIVARAYWRELGYPADVPEEKMDAALMAVYRRVLAILDELEGVTKWRTTALELRKKAAVALDCPAMDTGPAPLFPA